MPAVSRHQQRLFGSALAYKRGETEDAPDEVKRIADTMDEETIRHFADTPTEGLPERVKSAVGPLGAIKPLLGIGADSGAVALGNAGANIAEKSINAANSTTSAVDAAQTAAKVVGKPLVTEAGAAAETGSKVAPLLSEAGAAGKVVGGAVKAAPFVAAGAALFEGGAVLHDREKAREETQEALHGKNVAERAAYGAMNPMHALNEGSAVTGEAIGAIGELGRAEQSYSNTMQKIAPPVPRPPAPSGQPLPNAPASQPSGSPSPTASSTPQPMDKPGAHKEIVKDHLVNDPQEYAKEAAQRHCNLLARRMERPDAEAAMDRFLESLGMERDDAGEIKCKAFAPRLHKCPECHGENARLRTAHEDTGMECQELKCPDCGFFCEDIDDLHEKENPSDAQGESGEEGEHEGEAHKTAAAQSAVPLTGPEAIAHALGKLDLEKVDAEARAVITGRKVSKRPHAVQVLNVLEGLKRNNLRPSDLMINSVPVIPPAFRPFSVVGNTFVPGDANELYRDLIHLRDGYKDARELLGDEGTQDTRLALYDAVKALYGYGEPTSPKTKQRGVAGFLKQVSGVSPKYSFFQRKMISKPMDSVSRGTITVDPDLSLDEVGVPEDMAWTMYKPYVQRRLTVSLGMTPTDSLTHVTDRTEHARKALLKEMEERPVIYTRAPSWHKFNVLAGRPKLIDGKTIAINPLVTTGQNADFDGDAMNLHVPSHPEAVKEAYDKLMPSKMLWSIRDQDKVVPTPKQEQILGAFTAVHRPAKNKFKFASRAQAVDAIRRGQVSLSDEVDVPDDTPLPL